MTEQLNQSGLRRKIFRHILTYVLIVLILCGTTAAVGIYRITDFTLARSGENTKELLKNVRSGFAQSEMYTRTILCALAREEAAQVSSGDPRELLYAVCARLDRVVLLGDEICFITKDGVPVAACTGIERADLDLTELRTMLAETVEADPFRYLIAENEGDKLPSDIFTYAFDQGGVMAFSNLTGYDAMLDIEPLTDSLQFGIYTHDTTAARWMEAMGELQADYENTARKESHAAVTRTLLFVLLIFVVLSVIEGLIVKRTTANLVSPVEKAQLEKELQLARVEEEKRTLTEVDRRKTESLGNISHELKTPLTVVSGYVEECQHLLHSQINEDVLKKVDRNMLIVVAESKRLAMMVSQVLDITAIDEGKMVLHPQECSMVQIVQEVLNTYFPVFSANGNSLTLRRRTDRYQVFCDKMRIQQVLINILSNASRYTRNGEIVIILESSEEALVCRVQDNGVGIEPENLPRIFDRYFREDAREGSSRNTGTGLGLYISRHIVEAHGGTISIESTQGEGTTVSFTIPWKSALSGTDTSCPA